MWSECQWPQRAQVLQQYSFLNSAICRGVHWCRFHLCLGNKAELARSVSDEWDFWESHWRKTEAIGSYVTESINCSFLKVLVDSVLWEVTEERIEMRWLASILLLDKSIKAVSDSGYALLLLDLILATAAANCDSKFWKLSLLPRFVNNRFWKSL